MYLGYIVDALKTHVFPLPLLYSPLRQSQEKQHTYVHAVKYTCWLYTTQISYVTTQCAWKKTATDWEGLDHTRIAELVPTVGTNTLTSHTLTNGLNQVKYTYRLQKQKQKLYVYSVTSAELCFLKRSIACLCMWVATWSLKLDACRFLEPTTNAGLCLRIPRSFSLKSTCTHTALQSCHVLTIHLIVL